MSDTASIVDVAHGTSCSCDYCHEIAKLTPKLARPGWIWEIGDPADQSASRTLEAIAIDKAAKKDKKRRARQADRKAQKFARCYSGGFTRNRKAA